MNIVFKDKEDIEYNNLVVDKLRAKNLRTADYYTLLCLHDDLIKKPEQDLTITGSIKYNQLSMVTYFSPNKYSENTYSHSPMVVKRLLKSQDKIPFDKNFNIDEKQKSKEFSYIYYNDTKGRLNFFEKCFPKNIINKYKYEFEDNIRNKIPVEDMIMTMIESDFDMQKKSYENAKTIQDIKKMYFKLSELNDKYSDIDSFKIYFSFGVEICENKIYKLEIISNNQTHVVPWSYEITQKMGIDLNNVCRFSQQGQDDMKIITIKNNNDAWLEFDKELLKNKYDYFNTISLNNSLKEMLPESPQKSLRAKI